MNHDTLRYVPFFQNCPIFPQSYLVDVLWSVSISFCQLHQNKTSCTYMSVLTLHNNWLVANWFYFGIITILDLSLMQT